MFIFYQKTGYGEEEIYEIKASALNVRNGPGLIYGSSGFVFSSQKYVAIQKEGEWIQIWYQGKKGWIHNNYVQKVESPQKILTVHARSLNVR
ncbi:MAG: hypothetical protein D6785_16770 [Planctomycetota bacterium]|nr:MAG: hypothetical protein D6785_16770 [Planctomycetota bacterium]